MKKIGIVTLYHKNDNFGGLLQAYALPTALQKYFSISSEQIDYACSSDSHISSTAHSSFFLRLGIKFISMLLKNRLDTRKKKFAEFRSDIPHSDQTYYRESLSQCIKNYSKFICGGDQIWNDYSISLWISEEESEFFTLQFVPDEIPKIAYSPSIATESISNNFGILLSKNLSRFQSISVREQSSVSILHKWISSNISVVVDPVLLLTPEDWQTIVDTSTQNRNYILCYLLNDNTNHRAAITHLSKQLHLKIVTFPHIHSNVVRKCDLFFGNIHDYSSGPKEFVDLIRHASLVITDSFHACVFSLIFKTPFCVLERDSGTYIANMNSRIYNFLNEYHLENQLMTAEQLRNLTQIPTVDFSYAHTHLEKRRLESLDYLNKALK